MIDEKNIIQWIDARIAWLKSKDVIANQRAIKELEGVKKVLVMYLKQV